MAALSGHIGATWKFRGASKQGTEQHGVFAGWNQRSIVRAQPKPRASIEREKRNMRSDLIFGALTHVSNRYKLCQLASKATRKLHKPNTRLQDTTNEVLERFKDTIPMSTVEEVDVDPIPERRAA
jgi:hypothetical protein